MGGMGNQMFQYAMGLAWAKRLEVDLQLNTWWFKAPLESWMIPRRYNLCLWEGVTQLTNPAEPKDLLVECGDYNSFLTNLKDHMQDGKELVGYWQSEKYFQEIRQELLSIFQPKQPKSDRTNRLIEMISKEGNRSAALVVRMSDCHNGSMA